MDKVKSKLYEIINDESVVVLSGSVPKNVDKNIYMDFIEKVREKGAKVILDADGELLKNGIKAGPYMIKPNINELEEFFNEKIENTEEAVRLSRKLFKYGIEIIVISLGYKGALFIKKDMAAYAHGLKVDVKSTVGAGDAMVAALAVSLDNKLNFEKSIGLALACGTANVTTSGTQVADIGTILDFEKQVEFEYLNF